MTLLLPTNIIMGQATWNYAFGHNETHKALALDYGSIINHHESANTRAVHFSDFENSIHFQVRVGVFNMQTTMLNACTHATIDTYPHKHFVGHERYRGWSGNFCSVSQLEVV